VREMVGPSIDAVPSPGDGDRSLVFSAALLIDAAGWDASTLQ
jgi:hypothetical protein